ATPDPHVEHRDARGVRANVLHARAGARRGLRWPARRLGADDRDRARGVGAARLHRLRDRRATRRLRRPPQRAPTAERLARRALTARLSALTTSGLRSGRPHFPLTPPPSP